MRKGCGITKLALTANRKMREPPKRNPDYLRKKLQATWDAAKPVTAGDPVALYLRNRIAEFNLRFISVDIRYHPGLELWDSRESDNPRLIDVYPAMIGRVRNGAGRPISLHRTYLTAAGKKAPVDADLVKKQMTGVEKLDGGAIHLMPVGGGPMIGVAEGIETAYAALTATNGKLPLVSTLNAGNMAKFVWPTPHTKAIVIFEDNDPQDARGRQAGKEAADALEKRAVKADLEVRRRRPKSVGQDFCDVWNMVRQFSCAA